MRRRRPSSRRYKCGVRRSLCDDRVEADAIDAMRRECASVSGEGVRGRQTPSTRHSLGRHRRDAASGRDWNQQNAQVPADARPLAEPENPEEAQRRLGNEKFSKGDYEGAVRSYSLCLGLKARNHVALSNRAMAYLKQNQYNNAEADCDTALTYEPDHFKSLQRRATARHALGKHRAAAQDVMRALRIEPSSKALLAQQQRILAALRSAAADAPFVSVRAAEAS